MLDDFKQDEQNEDDKIEGEDGYIEKVVDADEFADPNMADDPDSEAETVGREVSLEELAEKELEDDNSE